MNLDGFSPTAPARIKSVIVPVGRVRQSQFSRFVRRLQKENVVRLGDVSPDGRPNRTMFSPLAFPDGLVHFDISPSLPQASHPELVPFECYRLPLLVIGVADWKELKQQHGYTNEDGDLAQIRDALAGDIVTIRDDRPSGLAHRILIFDVEKGVQDLGSDMVLVPPVSQSRTTTIKTIMCDLTSLLLAELSSYAKFWQEKPTIETPKSIPAALPNGVASSIPSHLSQSARPMSMAFGSRSTSPIVEERADHRMSMPVYASRKPQSGSSTPTRYGSPPRVGASTPPFRSEETLPISSVSSPGKPSLDRHAHSQDRLPTPGVGSSGVGELERSRGKARVGVVVGSLYLLAGRWPDAIRELSRSATMARSSSDYVWQAKALDYLVVCLLMCGWAGMDFKIPDVLRPASELLQSGTGKASKHSRSGSQNDVVLSRSSDAAAFTTTLQSFAKLLPDLIHNILNLYSRANTFTEDKLPLISYYHSTIRLANLLIRVHPSRGELNRTILDAMILGSALGENGVKSVEDPLMYAKPEAVNILLRAYPIAAPESSLSTAERVSVLAAIAGILVNIGQHRKAALILREILSAIAPPLVQARKDDAAEMGVHPAASLATLNTAKKAPISSPTTFAKNDTEDGVEAFLQLACQNIAVPPLETQNEESFHSSNHGNNVELKAMEQAVLNCFGALDLKFDMLRACINVCEALPNLTGALRYSAVLLRTAGSGVAPAPESSNGTPTLAVEEQERLASNISRTLGAAQHLGLDDLEANYWDDFLVRGIELVDGDEAHRLTPHAKKELEVVKSQDAKKEKDPFIFNPFLKPKSTKRAHILVAEEQVALRVLLQNLLDFEIVVDKIMPVINGICADRPPQTVVLGPYRTQSMLVYVKPQENGEMVVGGCRAKIRGCRERDFSLFAQPWSLKGDMKGKHLYLRPSIKHEETVTSDQNTRAKSHMQDHIPKTDSVVLKVIKSQPTLALDGLDVPQGTINVLEGERRKVRIRLRNNSLKIPADLVLLSMTDSISISVQDSLARKEISATELYELELGVKQAALRLISPSPAEQLRIEPLARLDIEVEVVGKPSLTYGTIQADYGFIGMPVTSIKDEFYTRQVKIPMSITVGPSLKSSCSDILPLSQDFDQGCLRLPTRRDSRAHVKDKRPADIDTVELHKVNDDKEQSKPQCLLILDFHNFHSSALIVHLEVTSETQKTGSSSPKSSQIVFPDTTTRIPVTIPRVYLAASEAHAPIPSLNPASKRQFVVSSTAKSVLEERQSREAFWYRESVLSTLTAHWVEETTGRTGTIDLRRGFQLTNGMLSTYKLPDVSFSMSISEAESADDDTNDEHRPKQLKPYKWQVPTSIFLTLRTKLRNRSPESIRPLLRLQPSLAHQPLEAALDLHRKLLVNGLPQREIPVLEPESEAVIETGFVVLSKGVYEWSASVEEMVSVTKPDINTSEGSDEPKARKRGKTGDLDINVGGTGRRTWIMERPLTMVAREVPD